MKKRWIWIGAVFASLLIVGGGIYAHQQQKVKQQTLEQKKKDDLAAKKASEKAAKELEKEQRAEIVEMPSEPTKPMENIERGWNEDNAKLFVTRVSKANAHREGFPKLVVSDVNGLQDNDAYKPYFSNPYWAVTLQNNKKSAQVFLKNNKNHSVTLVVTNGDHTVPEHQYLIDSQTYQMISDKKVDVATSITAWPNF